jgi:hypothetical protein
VEGEGEGGVCRRSGMSRGLGMLGGILRARGGGGGGDLTWVGVKVVD